MADDRQNNKNSALSTAANAASFAKGAMKTGKTIAGATKGAAAGPYGMLAAGLWENRNLVGKIIAGACVLFMLPVLFLAMLPSLIFGTDGMDTASKDTLNNPDVIMENLATTEGSIEAILREKHDALIESILSEADKLGANCEYSITDEFADRIIHESSMIISQFCASQNDYKEIKLSKLEKTLRKNLKKVFSYSVNTSTYIKEDETTKANIIVTHYEYVIEYAGSDYFANEVFSLTSEQKQLAEDYALNMQRFLYSNVYQIKPNWSLIAGETGEKAVGYGILMLDTPYSQERRNEEGYFDCSSFTYWVYGRLGIYLQYDGANTAAAQGRYIVENNLVVDPGKLAPGDLIFYSFETNDRFLNISHVAIYAGNDYVVDASSSQGKVVYRKIYDTDKIVLCGRPYTE